VIVALIAAPALSVSELDVAAISDVGVKIRVNAPAVPVITRFVKVATPLTAATVVVPVRVPVPDAIDATILLLEVVIVFSDESVILMTG
jgi:hypothetical protein